MLVNVEAFRDGYVADIIVDDVESCVLSTNLTQTFYHVTPSHSSLCGSLVYNSDKEEFCHTLKFLA